MNSTINPNDVLLGRGGNSFRHVGNRRFRELAGTLALKYCYSSKLEKSQISKQMVKMVNTMDPPGRFLKKIGKGNEWEEVSNVIAREKASQCLRDAVSALPLDDVNVPAGGVVGKHTKQQTIDSDSLSIITPRMKEKETSSNSARSKTPCDMDSIQKHQCERNSSSVLWRGQEMHEQMNLQRTQKVAKSLESTRNVGADQRSFENQLYDCVLGQHVNHTFHGDDIFRNASSNASSQHNYYQNMNVATNRLVLKDDNMSQTHKTQAPRPSVPSEILCEPQRPCASLLNDGFNVTNHFSSSTQQHVEQQPAAGVDSRDSTPDKFLFGRFFHDIDNDVNKSSLPSRTSPSRKRVKKQSSDEFDLRLCHSTSHSIDSIDSFTKPL